MQPDLEDYKQHYLWPICWGVIWLSTQHCLVIHRAFEYNFIKKFSLQHLPANFEKLVRKQFVELYRGPQAP